MSPGSDTGVPGTHSCHRQGSTPPGSCLGVCRAWVGRAEAHTGHSRWHNGSASRGPQSPRAPRCGSPAHLGNSHHTLGSRCQGGAGQGMGTDWHIPAGGTGCGPPSTGRSGRGPQGWSTLGHAPSENHFLCSLELGRSGSSAQASGLARSRGWVGTSWARSEPGSSGRSTGDKGWSWTGSWPLPRKAAPHTHSLAGRWGSTPQVGCSSPRS